MITPRRAADRGRTRLDWLDSAHSFSFGGYHDPEWMGFRSLRVINEDVVRPGRGFGTHPHRDMEIVTWVLSGSLEHRDSMGNGSVIRPGDVQRMSAGTGVTHSEWNPSAEEPVHLLQIWILPERTSLEPGYEEARFDPESLAGGFRVIASRDGRDGSVTVHRDAEILVARLDAGGSAVHRPAAGRGVWVQVAGGEVEVNGERLGPGDGAAAEDEERIRVEAVRPADVILFDLGPEGR